MVLKEGSDEVAQVYQNSDPDEKIDDPKWRSTWVQFVEQKPFRVMLVAMASENGRPSKIAVDDVKVVGRSSSDLKPESRE